MASRFVAALLLRAYGCAGMCAINPAQVRTGRAAKRQKQREDEELHEQRQGKVGAVVVAQNSRWCITTPPSCCLAP